jgi:predicted nicotinamide N-methyase
MTESLQGKTVLLIGRGSGIAGTVVAAARAAARTSWRPGATRRS